ncbi:hypothetical protein IQ243_10575 [Nostocales cyanobacterium LEGE 11386]|nr:hypothetical protein [Nostocales cyanobacterium LEGE 11386]
MNNSTPPHPSPPTQDNTHNIVIGQKINPDKIQCAKELRRHMTPAEKIHPFAGFEDEGRVISKEEEALLV